MKEFTVFTVRIGDDYVRYDEYYESYTDCWTREGAGMFKVRPSQEILSKIEEDCDAEPGTAKVMTWTLRED